MSFDSWDGEQGQVFVDGQQVWQQSNPGTRNNCNGGVSVSATVAHTADSLTLRVTTSTLDEGAGNEAFGIDSVSVTVRHLHGLQQRHVIANKLLHRQCPECRRHVLSVERY